MSLHPAPPMPLLPGEKAKLKPAWVSPPAKEKPGVDKAELIRGTKGMLFRQQSMAFEQDFRKRVVEPRIRELIKQRAEAQARPPHATSSIAPPNMASGAMANMPGTLAHLLPARPANPYPEPVIPSSVSPVAHPHSPIMSPPRPATPIERGKSETPDVPGGLRTDQTKNVVRPLPSFVKRRPRTPPPAAPSHRRRAATPERPSPRPLVKITGRKDTDSVISDSVHGSDDDSSMRETKASASDKGSVMSQPLTVLPYVAPPRKPSGKRPSKIVAFTSSEEEEESDGEAPLVVRASPRKDVDFTSSEEEEEPEQEMVIKKQPLKKGKAKLPFPRPPRTGPPRKAPVSPPPFSVVSLGTPKTPGFPTDSVVTVEPEPFDRWSHIVIPEGEEVDPFAVGLAEDDEDLYYLQRCLKELGTRGTLHPEPPPEVSEEAPNPHQTGSARTEGYYKIAAAQKSAYLPQRNRAMVDPATVTASVTVGRNARATTRRLVTGIEQQQGNKTSTSHNDVLRFNQLRARKKQLKFARSRIRKSPRFLAAQKLIRIQTIGACMRWSTSRLAISLSSMWASTFGSRLRTGASATTSGWASVPPTSFEWTMTLWWMRRRRAA
jgi:hypothetical protein